jgi:hypothetical protein
MIREESGVRKLVLLRGEQCKMSEKSVVQESGAREWCKRVVQGRDARSEIGVREQR